MKRLTTLLFLFHTFFVIAQTQPTPVATWNYTGFSTSSIVKAEQDSLIAFVMPQCLLVYNVNTQLSQIINQRNVGEIGRPYLNKLTGNYFVKRSLFNGNNHDSLLFFSFKTLKTVNLGLCGKSKTGEGLTFLNFNQLGDTIYVMVNNTEKNYKVYKIINATVYDININLPYPIVGEFNAKNDTFLFVTKYKGDFFNNVALQCKIGAGIKTLYESFDDSISLASLYHINGRAYVNVRKKYGSSPSKYYESSFANFDAKPSSFTPPAINSNYLGQLMKDGTWRRINYTNRTVERYDSTGHNLIRAKSFPNGFFETGVDRTVPAKGISFWVSTTNDYGIEPCILTEDDTFIRYDVTPGMYGSYKDEYNLSRFSADGDTVITTIKNETEGNNYLYRICPKLQPPFEPIFNLGKDSILNTIRVLFAYRNNVYYLTDNSGKNEFLLYKVPLNSSALAVSFPKFSFDKTEWHQQLGNGMLGPAYGQINTGGINLVDSGAVIVSAFSQAYSAQLARGGYLLAYQEQIKHQMKAGQFTAKFRANGSIDWITSYGKIHDFYDRNFHQVVDKNGDVYVAGQTGNMAIFGKDTFRVNIGSINFILKLNGKTGEILWYKILFSKTNSDQANTERLAIDSLNNLYLAIKYSNNGIQILNTYLSNQQVSPANALVKLNSNGELIWAVNTITPFTQYYGLTRAMSINHALNKIVLLQSIGYYNWSSTCKYNTWYTYLQSVDMESGNISWTKLYSSDDLHSTTSITLNKQGDLLLGGYFRGTIKLDDYTYTSKPYNGCNQFQPFFAVLKPTSGTVLFAQTSETDKFFPFEMKTAPNGNVWVVGAKELVKRSYNISLMELDEFGVKIRERNYIKFADPFQFGFFPRIDVNQSHVVFADAVSYDLDTFKNCFPYGEQLSIVKLAVNDVPETNRNWPVSSPRETDCQVLVYPNPAKDQLMLISDELDEITTVQVMDFTGRELQVEIFHDSTYHDINISALPAGVYFLKIDGNRGSKSIKFVKSE